MIAEEIVSQDTIEHKIFLIRCQKVMLDKDLAQLFGVETRVLNQSVQRNIARFPDDFMVALTRDEIRRISQIVISSEIKYSKRVYAPLGLCRLAEHQLKQGRESVF